MVKLLSSHCFWTIKTFLTTKPQAQSDIYNMIYYKYNTKDVIGNMVDVVSRLNLKPRVEAL